MGCMNRRLNHYLFSDLDSEWQRGWRWLCFDKDLNAFVVLIKLFMLRMYQKKVASLACKGQVTEHTTGKWSIQNSMQWPQNYRYLQAIYFPRSVSHSHFESSFASHLVFKATAQGSIGRQKLSFQARIIKQNRKYSPAWQSFAKPASSTIEKRALEKSTKANNGLRTLTESLLGWRRQFRKN